MINKTKQTTGTLLQMPFLSLGLFRLFSLIAMVLLLFACSPSDNRKQRKSKKVSSTQSRTKKSSINKDVERIVKGLIKSKGNLNQRYNTSFKKDDNKIPILLWAVTFHDVNSVKLLLDNGADPNISPMKGSTETPLFEVAHGTDLETAADRRMFNARGKSAQICKLLVKAGADVKHKNSIGGTPLMKAAGNGREDICAILISAGADVNKTDRMGATALHEAAEQGYWKVVATLLKKRAKAKIKDRMGNTPLSLAEKRSEEGLHKKCRGALPEAYATADYDKTISLLKKR